MNSVTSEYPALKFSKKNVKEQPFLTDPVTVIYYRKNFHRKYGMVSTEKTCGSYDAFLYDENGFLLITKMYRSIQAAKRGISKLGGKRGRWEKIYG